MLHNLIIITTLFVSVIFGTQSNIDKNYTISLQKLLKDTSL